MQRPHLNHGCPSPPFDFQGLARNLSNTARWRAKHRIDGMVLGLVWLMVRGPMQIWCRPSDIHALAA